MGVEFWGTFNDLNNFYYTLGEFWNDENNSDKPDFLNRDKLISGFSYEIRKAKEGSRQKRANSHYSLEPEVYYGCKLSWVHILFSLAAVKYNMRFQEVNKFEVAQILQIEFWLERAMRSFDEQGANELVGYIEDGLYGANKYIYHYMRCINLEYFLLGGGKKAFRKLSSLLRKGVYLTDEYKQYAEHLENEAKRLGCDVNDVELSDDEVDYGKLKW